MKAVVIGGGVAGLSAATGLRQVGVEAVVYERTSRYAPRGFGFLLLPNGLRALTTLGLEDQVRAEGCRIERAWMRTSAGASLCSEELSNAFCISRADLISLLLAALPPQSVVTGTTFADFVQKPDGTVTHARFENGETVAADLFIAADGTSSRIRHTLFPEHHCEAGRVKELVCSVPAPDLAAEIGTSFIKTLDPAGGLAFGTLSSGADRLIWFLQYDSQRWHLPDHDIKAWSEFVLTHVGHWPAPIPALLAQTDFSHTHLWHTADMDPLPHLTARNVVLVGDAAHVLLPFTSQGANSALEDAVELADCLAAATEAPDQIPNRLAAFNDVRREPLQRYCQAGRDLAAAFVKPESGEGAALLPLVM